ncbi:hypothetical protein K5B75_002408 [Salmonella enterica subsp. enterica serovar Ank]|nr:hypothetical protein [Salmonella enterica subsp. enterica serovar Ank]
MLVIWRDPRGVTGKDVYELDCSLSLQQNIARLFPGGLNADSTTVLLNGERINPQIVDLSRNATQLDRVEIILRQRGIGTMLVVAIVAAVAVVALMPKPTIPNSSGSQKDSPNNELTGQTNVARVYQAVPDIYGKIRAFPDLVAPSLSEYVDNVKNVTELLCVGIGSYQIENVKYADTLLSTISGASYEIFNPGDTIPLLYDAAESPDVDGQEITPPNLGDTVLYSATTNSVVAVEYASGSRAMSFTVPKSSDFQYFLDKSKPINVRITVNLEYSVVGSNGKTATQTGQFQVSGQIVSMGQSDSGDIVAPENYYDIGIDNATVSNDFPADGAITGDYLKIEDMEALFVGPFIMASDSDQIWYNVIFQRGLDGTANLTAEWWQVDADNNVIEGTEESDSFSYSDDTYEGQYFTRKIVPKAGRGRYAFRISRTNNGSDQLTDQAKLEEVYSIQVRQNVKAKDTLIRCVTTATEQATGIKDRKFNAEVTRKTITWSGSRIVSALSPSRDFADAVLHSFVTIAGRDAGELDTSSLYAISKSLKAKNERLGWFDFSFDDKDISLGQRLQTICNAARVTVFRDGLKWRFVRDEKKSIISAQFDARNLANADDGGTLQYRGHLPTSYDGIELEWVDSSDTNDDGTDKKAYIRLRIDASSRRIVEQAANRPNKIQLAGCRNKDQAMNRAQLEARRLIYQRLAVEDTTLNDAWMVSLGDRVRWADVYDEAIASGEILSIDGNVFTTSETLIFESGQSYKASITDQYGYPSPWITAAPVSGNNTAFSADFSSAYTADGITSMLGSRFILTPAQASEPMDFILTEKGPGTDPGQLKISLSQYDERIYEYD